MVLVLSQINCTLLKERMKSGQNYTKNQPLGTPEGLISRTRLKNGHWTWNFGILHKSTKRLCYTNFKRNCPTFISKSALVSQAEALNDSIQILFPQEMEKLIAFFFAFKLSGPFVRRDCNFPLFVLKELSHLKILTTWPNHSLKSALNQTRRPPHLRMEESFPHKQGQALLLMHQLCLCWTVLANIHWLGYPLDCHHKQG